VGFSFSTTTTFRGYCLQTVIQPLVETTGLLISWIFSFLPWTLPTSTEQKGGGLLSDHPHGHNHLYSQFTDWGWFLKTYPRVRIFTYSPRTDTKSKCLQNPWGVTLTMEPNHPDVNVVMSTLDVMSRVFSLRTSTCLSKNSGETWDADTLTCTVDTTGVSSTAQCAVKKAGLTVVTTVSSLSHPRACSPSSLRLVSPQFNCNNRTLAVTRCAFLHTLRVSIRATNNGT